MNTFGTITSLLNSSRKINITSLLLSYSNPISLIFTGGTNYVDLSNTAQYSKTAAGINNTAALGNNTYAVLKYNNNNLKSTDFATSNFTIYLKYATKISTLPVFNIQTPSKITINTTTVNVGSTFTIKLYSLLLPGTPIPYTITGCTSADINGAPLTGTYTAPYQSITYTVLSGAVVSGTAGATISITGGNTVNFTITNYTADEISTNTSFNTLISSKPPLFIFSPSEASTLTNNNTQMKDVRSGYTSYATMSNVTVISASGGGATGTITYLSGTTSSSILFPTGSIPNNFTICSITRYKSTNQKIILQNDTSYSNGSDKWFLFGHYAGQAIGAVFVYGTWKTPIVNLSAAAPTKTNWVTLCGRTSNTQSSYDIMVDGEPKGTQNIAPSTTNSSYKLAINPSASVISELADFDFASLYIWNQELSDAEMITVSKKMKMYLKYGVM